MLFWPHVGKAKKCLRGCRFFQSSKSCLQLLAVCLQIFKKSTVSQMHFGFTNIRSKVHCFSSTAIYFWQFLIGTPCMIRTVGKTAQKYFWNKFICWILWLHEFWCKKKNEFKIPLSEKSVKWPQFKSCTWICNSKLFLNAWLFLVENWEFTFLFASKIHEITKFFRDFVHNRKQPLGLACCCTHQVNWCLIGYSMQAKASIWIEGPVFHTVEI